MMALVDREPTRKVHIVRILGTNKDGEVLPDIWVDVERFDQYAKATQSGDANQYQQVITKLRWHDDPDNENEYRPEDDKGTARNTVVLKVCSPDEADLNDPQEWVPVRVIKAVHLVHGDDQGSDTNQKFITDDAAAERAVKPRRVSHYDTSIDAKATAAFEADPERRAYVVTSAAYQKDDDTKDEEQYIEYEIVSAITKQVSAHPQSNGTDQRVIQKFKNAYLLDETEPALLEEVGDNDRNPPYRLDPFQNIINVNWAMLDQKWLMGIHGTSYSARDKDGTNYSNVNVGASGRGRTVVTAGSVAFGKKTDEVTGAVQSCFLRAKPFEQGNKLYLGTINPDDGSLDWAETEWVPPGRIVAISFARKKFYISYSIFDDDFNRHIHLAITTDCTNFTSVNPFPNSSGVGGGNVAFIKAKTPDDVDKYVITACRRNPDLTGGMYGTLVTSFSTDGLEWIDSYEGSPYKGIGRLGNSFSGSFLDSTVAAGNGIFVAAASKKNRFPNPVETQPDIILHSSAVAVSTNGTSWKLVPIPGAALRYDQELGDLESDTLTVVFVTDPESRDPGNPAIKGYFVAAGYDNGDDFTRINKRWTSTDGLSWEIAESQTLPNSPGVQQWVSLSAIDKETDELVNI